MSWRPMYGHRHLAVLLLPLALVLLVGVAVPLAAGLQGSLFGAGQFAGSYIALAGDPTFWAVLLRTLQTAFVVALICVVVAYPTAEFLARVPGSVRPIAFALVVIPLWSSVIARTYSWVGVFQRDGVIDSISGALGGAQLMLLYTPLAVVVGMVHVLLPLVLLPAYAAVRAYDQKLSFASRSLGGGPIRTFLRVRFPALAPQLLAAGVAVFILSLGFFVTPAILGGPRSQLVSNFISQQIFDRYDLPRAQAMSIVLLCAALLTLAAVFMIPRLIRVGRR